MHTHPKLPPSIYTDPLSLEANRSGRVTNAQQQMAFSPFLSIDPQRIGPQAALMMLGFVGVGYSAALLPQDVAEALRPLIFLVFLGSPWLVVPLCRWRVAVSEARNAQPEHAEVTLTLKEEKPKLLLGDRRLQHLSPLPQLPEGTYTAWYLPRSGVLLSLDIPRDLDVHEVEHALSRNVRRASGTTTEALSLNRVGQFAPGQERLLFRGYWSLATFTNEVVPIIVGVVFITWVAWYVAMHGMDSAVATLERTVTRQPVILLLFLFIPIGLWTGVRRVFLRLQDRKDRRVRSLEGIVTREVVESRSSVTYTCTIDRVTVDVSKDVYDAILEGERYRFYLSEHASVLVNFELVA